MNISDLEWDERNIEHIARHGVTPEEVEDVCFGSHLARNEKENRYFLVGQTATGRYLNIVIERLAAGHFRPITAFDTNENYRKTYRKRSGK